MEQADLTVRRIKDGTVIDHIDVGNGLKVLEALRINGSDGNVITIALNVPSGKLKKKDIIKVEGKFLEDDDTNKLAVIAPTSTVNIIKDYKLVEKRRVSLPNEIDRKDPALDTQFHGMFSQHRKDQCIEPEQEQIEYEKIMHLFLVDPANDNGAEQEQAQCHSDDGNKFKNML